MQICVCPCMRLSLCLTEIIYVCECVYLCACFCKWIHMCVGVRWYNSYCFFLAFPQTILFFLTFSPLNMRWLSLIICYSKLYCTLSLPVSFPLFILLLFRILFDCFFLFFYRYVYSTQILHIYNEFVCASVASVYLKVHVYVWIFNRACVFWCVSFVCVCFPWIYLLSFVKVTNANTQIFVYFILGVKAATF